MERLFLLVAVGLLFLGSVAACLFMFAKLPLWRSDDERTLAQQSRRFALFCGILAVSVVPRLLLDPNYHRLTGDLWFGGDLLGVAVLFWPLRFWPFRKRI